MKKERRKFSSEFKAKIGLASLREDCTVQELCEKYSLHPNQVYEWRNHILKSAGSLFEKEGKSRRDSDSAPRVESQNVGQTAYEEPAQSGSDNSQSSGGSPSDAVSDFGNTVAKAITDSASTVGGLFDFNLSPTEEQQSTIHKKKKPEKKKGRRIL